MKSIRIQKILLILASPLRINSSIKSNILFFLTLLLFQIVLVSSANISAFSYEALMLLISLLLLVYIVLVVRKWYQQYSSIRELEHRVIIGITAIFISVIIGFISYTIYIISPDSYVVNKDLARGWLSEQSTQNKADSEKNLANIGLVSRAIRLIEQEDKDSLAVEQVIVSWWPASLGKWCPSSVCSTYKVLDITDMSIHLEYAYYSDSDSFNEWYIVHISDGIDNTFVNPFQFYSHYMLNELPVNLYVKSDNLIKILKIYEDIKEANKNVLDWKHDRAKLPMRAFIYYWVMTVLGADFSVVHPNSLVTRTIYMLYHIVKYAYLGLIVHTFGVVRE